MQGRVGVFFAALLTTVLLSPFASSEIVYSGVIAEIDDEIIAFELAENNTLTLVTSNGTVKHGFGKEMHFPNLGVLNSILLHWQQYPMMEVLLP